MVRNFGFQNLNSFKIVWCCHVVEMVLCFTMFQFAYFSLQVLSIIHKYIKYACELCIKGWCQEYMITIFLYIILLSEMVVW
jgi:hypothetical protein